jgi:hypothetical protein
LREPRNEWSFVREDELAKLILIDELDWNVMIEVERSVFDDLKVTKMDVSFLGSFVHRGSFVGVFSGKLFEVSVEKFSKWD